MLKLLRSFATGVVGIAHVAATERNMQIHLAAAVSVVVASIFLRLAAWEWVAVAFAVGLVLAAECLNTAVERLADRVSTEIHPLTKHAKDAASGGVLVLAVTAAVVGGIVFVPKLLGLIGG